MSFRATDLGENDARQNAADFNVVFDQYGQRDAANRRQGEATDPSRASQIRADPLARRDASGRSRPTRSEHADGCPSIGPTCRRKAHRWPSWRRARTTPTKSGVPDLAWRRYSSPGRSPSCRPAGTSSSFRCSIQPMVIDVRSVSPSAMADPWLISFLSVFAGRPGYEGQR